jgi:hypothetical protein
MPSSDHIPANVTTPRAEMTVRFEIWEQITGTTGLSTTA